MKTHILVRVKKAVRTCLARWKRVRPNEPFDPLFAGNDQVHVSRSSGHFAEFYRLVCAELELNVGKARIAPVACVALALLGEPDVWPNDPPQRADAVDRQKRRRLAGLIRTISQRVLGFPVAYPDPGQDRNPGGLRRVKPPKAIARLTPAQIKDPMAMAKKLTEQTDRVSAFLWCSFPPPRRAVLTKLVVTSGGKTKVRLILARQFNRVIKHLAVYDQARFSDDQLSSRTWALIERNSEASARARLAAPENQLRPKLNCSLLGDAYREELDLGADPSDHIPHWFSAAIECRGGHVKKVVRLERTAYWRPRDRLISRYTLADRGLGGPDQDAIAIGLAAWNTIQIALAHLNGWGRERVDWSSRDWDGLPRPAARALKAEMYRHVDTALNFFEGKDDQNHSRFRTLARKLAPLYDQFNQPALDDARRQQVRAEIEKACAALDRPFGRRWPAEYHPRVPGFLESQSREKWVTRIYHRFCAKAGFARCRCYAAVENAANQHAREATCEHFHNLAAWTPEGMDLPAFLRKAILGTHGKVQPVSLGAGLLSACLRAEFPLAVVDVAVWDCPNHPNNGAGKGLYADCCPECDERRDDHRHCWRPDPRWVLLGEGGGFEPRRMWACVKCKNPKNPRLPGNYFEVTQFLPDGRPDPNAVDLCPRCHERHTGTWATLYRYVRPLPGRVESFDPDVGPRAPAPDLETDRSVGQRFGAALEELTCRGYDAWVVAVLWAAFCDWEQNPNSKWLGNLIADDLVANWEAYCELKPKLPSDTNPPDTREEFGRLWGRVRAEIADLLITLLRPGDEGETAIGTTSKGE